MKRTIVVTGCIVLAAGSAACGGRNQQSPPPEGNFQQGTAGPGAPAPGQPGAGPGQPAPSSTAPPATGPAGSATPPPGQVPPIGTVMSDPNALQQILAGALAGGATTLGALAGGEQKVLEAGIQMQANQHAAGMQPEGQLMSAKLQQDAHAEGVLLMQPGACYTVIGFGSPGVFDYQINLITAPPMPPQIIAQSGTGGPAPVVGGDGNCVRSPVPGPFGVKVDLHVLKGQGLVGAQVYKK